MAPFGNVAQVQGTAVGSDRGHRPVRSTGSGRDLGVWVKRDQKGREYVAWKGGLTGQGEDIKGSIAGRSLGRGRRLGGCRYRARRCPRFVERT